MYTYMYTHVHRETHRYIHTHKTHRNGTLRRPKWLTGLSSEWRLVGVSSLAAIYSISSWKNHKLNSVAIPVSMAKINTLWKVPFCHLTWPISYELQSTNQDLAPLDLTNKQCPVISQSGLEHFWHICIPHLHEWT